MACGSLRALGHLLGMKIPRRSVCLGRRGGAELLDAAGARRRWRVNTAQSSGLSLGPRPQGSCSTYKPASVPQPETTPAILGTCRWWLWLRGQYSCPPETPGGCLRGDRPGCPCLRALSRMRGSSHETPSSLPLPVAGLLERPQPSLGRPQSPLPTARASLRQLDAVRLRTRLWALAAGGVASGPGGLWESRSRLP